MASLEQTRTAAVTQPFGGFTAILRSAMGEISAWNNRRMTARALHRLTDRELDDIGLVRGDIDLAVNRAIY